VHPELAKMRDEILSRATTVATLHGTCKVLSFRCGLRFSLLQTAADHSGSWNAREYISRAYSLGGGQVAQGVSRFSGGPLPAGASEVRWFWVAFPNNNPDISLTWELRSIRQSGHAGHPGHKVRLDLIEVERTDVDPNGRPVPRGWLTWFRLVSTGTHPTDWEMLANWQTI
jgi:hypothetical protein